MANIAEQLRDAAKRGGWLDRPALLDGAASWSHPVETAGDTPLYVQFTAGTTGVPKGVVHAHRDIAPYHDAVGVHMLGLDPSDVSLSVSKMFFAYGFGNSLVYPLCSGSSAVLIRARPTPETVAELVERHGVTVLPAVPSAYANLLAETGAETYRTIRVALSAGESLPVSLGQRASELLGASVLNELGSTEVGGAYCANRLPDNAPGTIGRPLRGYEVQIRDGSGAPVPDGTAGQLWVRGPTIFSEYLNPADREVAVAAIPDERGASKLRAFVVPVGYADPHTLAQELTDLARAELAAFKVPRSVELVERLPRTFTGKVQRFVVRQGAW